VAGYIAKVVDENMNEVPRGKVGRMTVRGPTGCRYLADARQKSYVVDGWNLTGDSFSQDADGFFHFAARNDDMIVSSDYNIAGPEVEAALLGHNDVAECEVIGVLDNDRGNIVQAHVKAAIAPFKYPRSVVFSDVLPKTQTGKIQRFLLLKI